jgi:hypothetical protein
VWTYFGTGRIHVSSKLSVTTLQGRVDFSSNGNQGVFALPKKWQAKDGSNENVVD